MSSVLYVISVICHQLNCISVEAKGLAEAISKKFPYADIYSLRKSNCGNKNLAIKSDRGCPGEITISISKVSDPIIIGIYGQYDYGKVGRPYSHAPSETTDMRILWFKSGLNKLKEFIQTENIKEVAFPYLIGCGLAGGDWEIYSKLLYNFAIESQIQVVIYKL